MTDHGDDSVYNTPLHAVSTRRNTERTRGRARSVAKRPTYRQAERLDWLRAQLDEHVEQDPLVQAAHERAGPSELAQQLCVELAREAACLLWDRQRCTPGTRDAERTSSRRIRALSDLARMILVRDELVGDEVDLRDARVQRVVGMFVRRVHDVVTSVLPLDAAERVIAAWHDAMVGWEDNVGP